MNTELHTLSVEALSFAVRQEATLGTKTKPLAEAILNSSESLMSDTADEIFSACRGEYLAAKRDGKSAHMRVISAAWNRISTGIRSHLADAGYSISFPNLRSGNGETQVITKQEASDARKSAKAEQAERDAADLATAAAQQQQQQIDALLALTPNELVANLNATLQTWAQDDARLIHQTIALLAESNGLWAVTDGFERIESTSAPTA
jgi:hypothetical protein